MSLEPPQKQYFRSWGNTVVLWISPGRQAALSGLQMAKRCHVLEGTREELLMPGSMLLKVERFGVEGLLFDHIVGDKYLFKVGALANSGKGKVSFSIMQESGINTIELKHVP